MTNRRKFRRMRKRLILHKYPENPHLGVRFTVEMKKSIKAYCRLEGITMSDFARHSIIKELKKYVIL